MNYLQIYGIFLRNFYLMRKGMMRFLGAFMWVTVELFFWGFITIWLGDIVSESNEVNFVLVLLSALIFWHILVRAQHSFSVSFLEDVFARNVFNMFIAPVSIKNRIAGLVFLSLVQTVIATVYVATLAFILYALNIWTLGFYLIPFFIGILMFGWAVGLLTTGLIIRFGPSVEELAFFMTFALLPFSAVYHPASVFPPVVQNIAQFIPTMHLFEGMRQVITEQIFPVSHVLWAIGLSFVYFALGVLFFSAMISIARRKGYFARFTME
jgi:ABC-2 type transport system permease protein